MGGEEDDRAPNSGDASKRKHRNLAEGAETAEESKRRKHRHHRHRSHRHRRSRSEKRGKEEVSEEVESEVLHSSPGAESARDHCPSIVLENSVTIAVELDDREEGEILEEEAAAGAKSGDGEQSSEALEFLPDQVKEQHDHLTGDRSERILERETQLMSAENGFHGLRTENLEREAQSRSPVSVESHGSLKEKARDDDSEGNSKRHRTEDHDTIDRRHRKHDRYRDKDDGDRDRGKDRGSAREGDREKLRASSRDRERGTSRERDRERSRDSSRDRERNRDTGQGRDREKLRDPGRDKERDRDVAQDRDRKRTMDSSRDRERGTSLERDWEKSRGSSRDSERDRDTARDGNREKLWDPSRDRERDRDSAQDRDRERLRDSSRDRERGTSRERGWEKSRGSSRDRERDRDTVRDRDRAKPRDSSRDRERYRGTARERDWEKTRDSSRDRERDRHRESSREKSRMRSRSRERERNGVSSKYSDRDRHREVRSEKHEESRLLNDSRAKEEEKMKENEDDYDEKIEQKLAEQEEEDPEKIIEESRRRRLAILEKYKQKQEYLVQHPKVPVFEEKEEEDKAASAVFSVEKSPQGNDTKLDSILAAMGGLGAGSPKGECSGDMFSDDIFGESPTGVRKLDKGADLKVSKSGLHDNWDDAEGYYAYRFGEVLDGRYEVIASHGKGVFSIVVRAKDLKAGGGDPKEVAIKIIRNNETMYKAGMEELTILKKLVGADPEDRRHCVRFLSSFKYRNHLCLVFESLHMNLREVLKKFGRNIGLKLTAVRAYAKQLFIALKHLRNCGVLHCDIKPDNMLVNEAKNVLKLCDFGNAMFAGKNEITPYLVSRFYRAPEIILGLPYDHPMDIWSVGCCLYELYAGKVLFPGPTNNDMLRLHMELKGPFPKKMLRKGAFVDHHFDQDLNFHATEEDPVTKKTIKRILVNIKPKDFNTLLSTFPGEDPKLLAHFKDLLERIFVLDPEKRMTVALALSHPFITGFCPGILKGFIILFCLGCLKASR